MLLLLLLLAVATIAAVAGVSPSKDHPGIDKTGMCNYLVCMVPQVNTNLWAKKCGWHVLDSIQWKTGSMLLVMVVGPPVADGRPPWSAIHHVAAFLCPLLVRLHVHVVVCLQSPESSAFTWHSLVCLVCGIIASLAVRQWCGRGHSRAARGRRGNHTHACAAFSPARSNACVLACHETGLGEVTQWL